MTTASVTTAELTSVEIRWKGRDVDGNGCDLGPTIPVYATGGPFALTYVATPEPHFELPGTVYNKFADFVAGIDPPQYSGGWYATFTITDLATSRQYLGTATFSTCY